MTFAHLLLNSLQGMWPGLLIWGFLPLIPFMIMEQLRPVGEGPTWREYGLNVLIGLSTALLALPLGLLAGMWSGALHRWLPWKPLSFSFDSLGGVPLIGSVLELLAMTLVALLLHDFWFYWVHRLEHKIPLFWAFHRLHHSDERMNTTTYTRDHFLQNGLLRAFVPVFTLGLFVNTPFAQAGKLALYSRTFFILLSMFYHSATRVSLPWLDRILVTPQVHRIHHSTDPRHYNRNFADALPIFDILFGTFHRPARDEFPPTGLGNAYPAPRSIWSAQFGLGMTFNTRCIVRSTLCALVFAAVSVLAIAPGSAVPAAEPPIARPWNDARLTPERRAELLNRELTLDERITLVHGLMALPFGSTPVPPEAIPAAGYVPGVSRLDIPALYESDASLGVTNPLRVRDGDGATALPSGLALAATFNPALAYAGGAMIGAEARAKGFNVLLAGGVNLTREPRNGRNFEYLGEDPLLAGTLAGESIRGIQSNHIISTTKHFALNDQETGRHVVNELLDEAALRESDLLAFELAIEGGRPGSVMCAYNKVNGPYACGNDFLLNHVLKGDWAFPGFVMSDWGAVYATDFAARGLDQQSGQQLDRQVWFGAPLRAAVQSGEIPASRLEDMTRRILRSMFANGLFDYPPARSEIDYAAHTEIARKEAGEAIVLLRNRDAALPLSETLTRILVVGGRADLGTLSGGGSSQVFPPHVNPRAVISVGGEGDMAAWRNMVFQSSPPLAAIRARAPKAKVTFNDGRYPSKAAALAKQSDIVIVFANQWTAEDEDVPDLSLPSGQDELIKAVAAANPHIIVVLQTGGPIQMPWLDQTAAVLEAWYPGAGGADAIADILFGIVNPSGRLPITFPSSVGPLPGSGLPPQQPFDAPHPRGSAVGYRAADLKPLFPFGYGLSYTHFSYHDLKVASGKALTVSFNVHNDGLARGKDTPQAYLTSAAGKPLKRLIGFTKIELDPHANQHVSLTVDPRLLADFDVNKQRWHITPGQYRIVVATSSADNNLVGDVQVRELWRKP